MFCNNCGNQIPDTSNFCPYCQQPVSSGVPVPGAGQRNMAPTSPRMGTSKIDNIFSALTHKKTPGVMSEFVLWCATCVMVIFSLLSIALYDSYYSGGYMALWIFIMLFEMGMGVLMAFRLKPIALLYAGVIFQFIMVIPYYITNCGFYEAISDDEGVAGIIIVLFIFLLLSGIGLATCSFIHFFSKINLGKIIAILSIVEASLLPIMALCLLFMPNTYDYEEGSVALFGSVGFGFGTISFAGISIITALYASLFFLGCIDSTKDKILSLSGNTQQNTGNMQGMNQNPPFVPGIQCVMGSLNGQTFYLQNGELSIGSQPGVHVVIADPYVSQQHCLIRFNSGSGYYEIYDVSRNGVYVNGMRLQTRVVVSYARGSILCIGSMGQQFRLL